MLSSCLRSTSRRKLADIPMGQITPSPFQPRRDFDVYELSELAASIKENGLLQPVTVRKTDNGYELISGERRYRASLMAGLKTLPAIVIPATDRQSSVYALLENIQRSDLNFFEEAEGIENLITEFGFSQPEIALCIGIAQSTLSNKLRILRLNESQRKRIMAASLTEHHARAFLRLEGEKREEAINAAIAGSLTAGETDKLVDEMLREKTPERKPIRKHIIRDTRILGNSISRMVKTFQRQGFDAKTLKKEDDCFLQYTIIIPKLRTSEEEIS